MDESSKTEQLIGNICNTVFDYRMDEEDQQVKISPESVKVWIDQFDKRLHLPILTELDKIFDIRYCSYQRVKNAYQIMLRNFATKVGFQHVEEFLKHCNFLSLQPEGKSQRVILEVLDSILQEKFRISMNDCGTLSHNYSVYCDDILSTGLTMVSDLSGWSKQVFSPGITNKRAVEEGKTILLLLYVFIHKKNYEKKKRELSIQVSGKFPERIILSCIRYIQNDATDESKIDLILPLEASQSQEVIGYRNSIINEVDEYTGSKNYRPSPEEFFRPAGLPKKEEFFTSPENRIILENAFLQKGIEILSRVNRRQKNMRALGYSLPSQKNFGFGTLCFTWRNIPNNTPLVFWYSAGGFKPLFQKRELTYSSDSEHKPIEITDF